ncbi:MAG: hypothetical protein FWC41_09745 [Firmicutes bacterium]|nr:hypothetical protein [Bacillota bacterium]
MTKILFICHGNIETDGIESWIYGVLEYNNVWCMQNLCQLTGESQANDLVEKLWLIKN